MNILRNSLLAVALAAVGARRRAPAQTRGTRLRFIDHLRPRRPQHRLGRDERPHRRGRRRRRCRTARLTVFVGAASGGVWKSLDGGTTFKPVFDKQPVQSIGAVAIDPSEPEDRLGRHRRGLDAQLASRSATASTSRPTAARPGPTWASPESERIVEILVDPDERRHRLRVRARASCGAISAERGVYRTTDGGKTWTLVLKGAEPLDRLLGPDAWIAKNPRRALRGLWDFRRKGWTFRSGGDGADGAERQRPVPSRATAARPGPSSRRRRTRASRRSPGAASRSRSRRRDPKLVYAFVESTAERALRLRRRRRDLGGARPAARGWSGGRSTSRA